MNRILPILIAAMFAAPTAIAAETGNMIVWDTINADVWCKNIDTGSEARELAAQDADVLRSLAATLATAQADLSHTLVSKAQSDWLYADYDRALGNLTDMSLELADEIVWLDQFVLSFEDTDEPLVGRQLRRAQRLCEDQADRLNRFSDLWTDTMAAAALITKARQDARVEVLEWRINPFMAADTRVVRSQLTSMNCLPQPPTCLDALDRRLRERGEYNCVDR